MANFADLTWDKLLESEATKPSPEARDRARRFSTEAGFTHPQQCMGLKAGDLNAGQNGVSWPDGHVHKALVKRMFDQVQALYSASRHRTDAAKGANAAISESMSTQQRMQGTFR